MVQAADLYTYTTLKLFVYITYTTRNVMVEVQVCTPITRLGTDC